ncbi:hypothetical protein KDL44_10540 [bacterium]|nr:hypothetical protein [bacterium]
MQYYFDNSWNNGNNLNGGAPGQPEPEFREDVRYSLDNGQESLESAWKNRVSEIDDYIKRFASEAGELSSELAEDFTEGVDNFSERFQEWFDRQPMSDELRADWAKTKADGKVLKARLEQRLTYLVENGKLKWKELTDSDDKH